MIQGAHSTSTHEYVGGAYLAELEIQNETAFQKTSHFITKTVFSIYLFTMFSLLRLISFLLRHYKSIDAT